jgi:hypothetical protein
MILDQGGEEHEVVAAKEEVGWCLVNEGQLNEGREILEEVVQLRDTKWEESGKEDEALPRARAWWRLGRVEWMIGGELKRTLALDLLIFRRGKQAKRAGMVHGFCKSARVLCPGVLRFGDVLPRSEPSR